MYESDQDCQERHILVIHDGHRRAVALDAAAYSMGRDLSNAIVVTGEAISRQHAILLRVPHPQTKGYRYRIIDGNSQGKLSANGIYLNGKRCTSGDLSNSDVISFGRKVTAVYMMVSMGEAEFVKYLDSIAYQSIKSDVVNGKETIASIESGMNGNAATAVLAPPAVRPVIPTVPSSSMDTAMDTASDNALKSGCDALEVGDPSRETRPDAPAPIGKTGLRLWMVIVATSVVTVLGVAGLWMLFGTVSPDGGQPRNTTPSLQVGS